MSSRNAQAAQGGYTEPQAEALFDCKEWTIEMASLCTRRRSHQKDDRRRQEVRARGGSVKPVSESVKPQAYQKASQFQRI
jgi:hypothetical protein